MNRSRRLGRNPGANWNRKPWAPNRHQFRRATTPGGPLIPSQRAGNRGGPVWGRGRRAWPFQTWAPGARNRWEKPLVSKAANSSLRPLALGSQPALGGKAKPGSEGPARFEGRVAKPTGRAFRIPGLPPPRELLGDIFTEEG